jgi:PAS domain-containing protein
MRRKNAKLSMELKSTRLGSISSALKHVYPPAVLGSLQNDALLVWNSAFQKTVGLSQDELARTPLTSVLILEENERIPSIQGHDAERDNQLLPCALRNSLTNVHGQALRCDDGMLLAMLDVTLGT